MGVRVTSPDVTPPAVETPPAQAPAATATPPAPPAQPETDWVAEARKWEARAKENFDKASKLDALEAANKTELEKANDRAAAAEKRAADLEATNLRDRIARKHNLPADLAARLVGADEAALEADAKKLQALVKTDAPSVPAKVPSIDQGVAPAGDAPTQLTAADLKRMTPEQIVKARNEGRCNDLLGIK